MGNIQDTTGINGQSAGTAEQIISENDKASRHNTERNEESEPEDSGLDCGSGADFSRLFDAGDVHLIASHLRDVKQTVYERCFRELKDRLERTVNRTETKTMDFSRFCDILNSLDLSLADLMQVFNCLDYEGRGSFEVLPVLHALRKNKKITLNEDLNSVLKRLEDCSWMPGFVDVYIDQKDSFKQHGSSILDYLLRNRFSGCSVNCQATELFEAACKLRERIVRSRIESLEFPSQNDAASLKLTDSLGAQTKPVLKKTDSTSGDDLLLEEVKKQKDKVHAGEALVLWYTQLIATTARACLPLAPELLSTALTNTRTMVNQLLPLCLCHDSEERPSFLNANCLHELGSLIQLFPEKSEVLGQSLSFNLACGSVSEILHCLMELNVSGEQIDCRYLLSNMDQVRTRLLRKHMRYLKVDLLGCDAEATTDQDPRSVLEANWKQSAFSTKPGETKVNFVFECSTWAEFTKIKIKVDGEKSAPSHGFVFVLAEWHVDADSSLKKELEKFSQCDNWTERDYKRETIKRLTGGRSLVTNEPVAYFSTKDSNEVDVVLDNPVAGKFIVVKFVDPREDGVDHLGIVGIKFYGLPITTGFGLLEQQISCNVSTAMPLESNQRAIQAVLRFLLFVFYCQAQKKQAVGKDIYHFSRENLVNVDKRTGIFAYNPAEIPNDTVSTLMAKLPFSKDCPYFEIEILNRGHIGAITVGAAPKTFRSGCHPGWEPQSYGYHADDGCLFVDGDSLGDRKARQCMTGDRMGCGVEFEGDKIKTIYFTRNGDRVHEYASSVANPPGGLFPTVGMRYFGEKACLISKDSWRSGDKPMEKMRTLVAAPGSDFTNPSHLDLSNVSIETLWKTYKTFPEKMDQSLFLQLISSMLPHLNHDSNNFKNTSEIFDHLCHLSDHRGDSQEDDIIRRSANDVIKDGLDLFFPCKEDRPKMLLDLLQESSESSFTGSKLILFQSLCHYFTTANLDVLLPLPKKPSDLPEDFNSSNLLSIMEKFLSISISDSLGLFQLPPETEGPTVIHKSRSQALSGRKKSEYLFHLSKLFNQLQVRLFAWISQELSKRQEATDDVDRLEKLIIHYCCQLIIPKAEQFLTHMKLLKDCDLRVLLPELDTSFLATTLRELVLLLSELTVKLSSHHKAKLLENLKPVMMMIRKLLIKLPDLLPLLNKNQGEQQIEKELRTWEVDKSRIDRPTDQENKIGMMFSHVGATIFEVEFDKTCTTDVYEYMEFRDSKGDGQRFSGHVGYNNWPMKIRFEGISAIHFTYSKDISSTSSTGYSFKVKAMQTKVSDFHWLYDIYLSFCRLFGRISASVLDKTPVLPNSATSQDKLEMQMYRSELWTTIFRGGLVAKKFERSLSGNYETADQSDVATFLNAVGEFKSEKAKAFINRCKSHHNHNHNIGGEEIDRAIASVFAALLWHTQSLRHDVSIYLRNELDGRISDGIHEAYAAAENLRLFLAERKQTMKKELEEQRERGEEEEKKGKEVTVDVVHLVEEKSKFLLQFAGLSRVALKAEELKKKVENRRSRQLSINRLSCETSVDLSVSVESKYPSFRLVFDFVQDIAWTKDKVEELLKKRYINSESLWKTYSFMSEFFRTISSERLENDMACTVFVRELLAAQDKFGRHFADGIDGCGLSMEANVRSSYYGLLRHLVALIRKDMTASLDRSRPVGSEILTTCVLHLLDIEWQAYDLPFVVELRLPELYLSVAKGYLPPVLEEPQEFRVDETEEEYRRNLEWATEARRDSYAFMSTRSIGSGIWLVKHIRARFQKLGLGSTYRCDGCRNGLSTDYYRCVDCDDVDICRTCYDNEVIPDSGGHNGEHNIVLFRYACKGCMGYIIATRWHCNECNDFDLCNGCHNSNNFPAGSSHNAEHNVYKIPTPKVYQSKTVTIKDAMSTYFHLHSWMLFSTTALSTLDFLLSKTSEEKVQRVDEDYLFSAHQLYSICLETAVDYLVQELSTDEVDSDQSIISTEASATQTNSSMEVSELGEGSLVAKIIGLIAALISPNNQKAMAREVPEVLSSEKFLMALFDIARAKKKHDDITRHMALGLLGKLLQQMNISSEASQSLKSSASGEMMIVDPKAVNLVQSLFGFGADCLERHGLDLAKSTSQVLNGLQTNPNWTQLLTHQFSVTVDLLHSSPTLSSIFALFAFTGFPEMLTVGTLVAHVEKDKEVIRSVVLKPKKSDQTMCTIVELASRKKKRMKETLLDVMANNKSFLTENQVKQFMKLIIDVVNQKIIPGLAVDVLSLWQLALIIKASLQSIHNGQSKESLYLYENSFLQCLSHLASLGTGLSNSLLVRDLEVLSVELNKRSQSEPDLTAEPEEVATPAGEDIAADNNDDHDANNDDDDDDGDDVHRTAASSSSSSEYGDPHTADYGIRTTNTELFETEEIADAIRRESGCAKKKRHQTTQKNGEIDTGIGIGQYICDLLHSEIEIDECIEESNPEKPCLITKSGDDDMGMARKRKEKSTIVMEKLLNSKEKGLLTKVNRALGILYARKLLMTLVSECPADKVLKSYITRIFFILPLLVGPGANRTLEKVIIKIVNCCQPDDIVSIAVATSFFVAAAEGQVVTVSKQLPPFLSKSGEDASSSSRSFMDEVCIPGATALKVELDKSSCGQCDVELVFSSSPDLTKNRQCFSGRSSETWEDFTIKGEHLYCTITGPDLAAVSSSYQFKVTGIASFSDHFDFGYLALSAIFDKPESVRLLPVGRLWKLLVGTANRSSKTKRLKAIRLLLRLISLQNKSRGCEELSLDLSLLKGLWQMYQKLMEATKNSTEVQPALVLALTELFFVAQNVAKEWNVVHDFMTSMEPEPSTPQA